MKKKIFIWKVEMEDLTHLGGPMGSEYVTHMGTEQFLEETDVIAFLKKKSDGQLNHLTSLKKEQYFDCKWIGFKVSYVEVK
jgi:hypothetical protein